MFPLNWRTGDIYLVPNNHKKGPKFEQPIKLKASLVLFLSCFSCLHLFFPVLSIRFTQMIRYLSHLTQMIRAFFYRFDGNSKRDGKTIIWNLPNSFWRVSAPWPMAMVCHCFCKPGCRVSIIQRCRWVFKSVWASSNVVGIICPPGCNSVNWTPKFRVG